MTTDYDAPKWLRIQVPSSLHKALRGLALEKETTLQNIVMSTLAAAVEAHEAKSKRGK